VEISTSPERKRNHVLFMIKILVVLQHTRWTVHIEVKHTHTETL